MAAAEQVEDAGNDQYQNLHMNAIFQEGFSFSGFERDMLSLNLGDEATGKRYLDISGISGIDSISDGRGSLFADFDNDGDLDIFLMTVQGEAHYLFRNNIGTDNGFVRVALEGRASGRDAFGTVVRVKTTQGIQTKIKSGGSGFLSQHDPRLLFGLGGDTSAEWIEVSWPAGKVERFERVASRSAITAVEGESTVRQISENRFSLPDPLDPAEALMMRLGLSKGSPLPEVTLKSLSGTNTSRLTEHLVPGRRTLVNFWATWCIPCALEMPELQELSPRFESAGIDLIGISVDQETAGGVEQYLTEKEVSYKVFLTDMESVTRVFSRGEVQVPFTILLDDKGRIEQIMSGWSEESRRILHELAGD